MAFVPNNELLEDQPADQQIPGVGPDEGTENEYQLLGDLFELTSEEVDFKRSDGIEGSSDGGDHGPNLQLVGQVDHFAHRRFVPEQVADPSEQASPEDDTQGDEKIENGCGPESSHVAYAI